MKCPACAGIELVTVDRQGVEIDCCPQCRGVWLDRGELDKIVERSTSGRPSAAMDGERTGFGRSSHGHGDHQERDEDSHSDHSSHDSRGRRRSWFSDLFD
ncbi:MAG: zf-TFIIB domain-containing protein [Myxococcota bacterium]